MVKRNFVIAAALVMALAGCTDGGEPAPVGNAPSHPPAVTSPSGAPPPGLPDLPKGFPQLIPATTSTEDGTLPTFSHKEKGYTILIQCSGGGKIEIKREKEPALAPFPCDGAPAVQTVRTDVRTHHLKVHVTGDARWGIRVVDGLAGSEVTTGG